MDKRARTQETSHTAQPSKYVYVPSNQASAVPLTGSSDDQQQQRNERWEDDGGDDSGLEDGIQTDFQQQKGGESSLIPMVFSGKPVLKSVMHVAKQSNAKSRLVTKVVKEKKLTDESETLSRVKGQRQGKKSIWERLGNKVGETSGKVRTNTKCRYDVVHRMSLF